MKLNTCQSHHLLPKNACENLVSIQDYDLRNAMEPVNHVHVQLDYSLSREEVTKCNEVVVICEAVYHHQNSVCSLRLGHFSMKFIDM